MPKLRLSDGCELYYRALGRGPTVLLLHGFGLDGKQWLPWIVPWTRQYRFLIPDLRGHGQSSLGQYEWQDVLNRLIQDIDELVAHFELESFALGGYSMGALVSLAYLAREPRPRVKRYLHIELGPRFFNGDGWEFGFHPYIINETIDLIRMWEARGWDADSRWLYERLLHRLCCDAFPRGLIRSVMAHIPISSVRLARVERGLAMDMWRYLLQDGGYDFRAALPKMDVPAILVAGEQSQYFPAAAIEWMQKVWPQSEFHLFRKSGHGLMISEPHRFAQLFGHFLDQFLLPSASPEEVLAQSPIPDLELTLSSEGQREFADRFLVSDRVDFKA